MACPSKFGAVGNASGRKSIRYIRSLIRCRSRGRGFGRRDLLPMPQEQGRAAGEGHDRHQRLIGVQAANLRGVEAEEFEEEPPHGIEDEVGEEYVGGGGGG